jgi:hypothetical protein
MRRKNSGVTFTQDQLTRMITAPKRRGLNSVLRHLSAIFFKSSCSNVRRTRQELVHTLCYRKTIPDSHTRTRVPRFTVLDMFCIRIINFSPPNPSAASITDPAKLGACWLPDVMAVALGFPVSVSPPASGCCFSDDMCCL